MTTNEALVLVGLAVAAFWVLGAHNRLVRLRQAIAAAFAQVDAHLRQRHELLGELIEAVAPALPDVPQATASLAAARQQARVAADHVAQSPVGAGGLASLALAEQVLRTALSEVASLVEARPALRGEPQVRSLLQNVSTAQHRVAAAGDTFNAAVLEYNRSAHQFPTRLVAAMFGFRSAGPL